MKPMLKCLIIAGIILSVSSAGADFDARYWAKYTEISLPQEGTLPPFGRIDLQNSDGPGQNLNGIRIITRGKREIPFQVVTRRPDTRTTEIKTKVVNMSLTPAKDTSFEGLIAEKAVTYNAIEIVVEGGKFFRQVQIFGGSDGVNWYKIRSDAVIFDYPDDKLLRHTRITLPDSRHRYLRVLINNRLESPLKITGLKIFHDIKDTGRNEVISGQIKKQETDGAAKTSSAEVELRYPTVLHGVEIKTNDKNYHRMVDVFIKRDKDQWTRWGSDFIFNFEGEGMMESKSVVAVPEVTAKDIKIVIRNLDSPPLKIQDVSAHSYQKTVVFKIEGRDNYFLFWGNPNAKPPTYDISGHVSRQNIDSVRIFTLEDVRNNPEYVGSDEALPFTERYKYLLYILVALVIAGLGYYQYRVIKRTGV
jgi:hypothetical protein